MFGYSVPVVINHGISVEDDINPPAGAFATIKDGAIALNGASLGSNGTGVRGHTDDGHGVHGYAQGIGIAVYGQAFHDGSTAMHADSEGANGVGIRCSATQSTSAAILIEGRGRTNQAATHTLGSYSGKAIPIYDTGGTLIGYIPIYA